MAYGTGGGPGVALGCVAWLVMSAQRRYLLSALLVTALGGAWLSTAQYGTTKPLKTDAWLMGFKGDIAFAALVVDSTGNGGPTCGPIVAKFLAVLY